jgi:hypothetical protein
MRPTGRCLDNFRLVTIGNQFVYFACVHMAEFEPRPAPLRRETFRSCCGGNDHRA